MIKKYSIVQIFSEFLTLYPRQFSMLFLLLIVEGLVAAISVMSLVPLADFMLDPSLAKPSQITAAVLNELESLKVTINFWALATLFILTNFLRASTEVAIKYSILRIKYDVSRGLISNALHTFFKARWEFFSGTDHGRLLNTMNRELSTIGEALGHLATLFAQLVQLSIYLAVPFWLNSKLAITTLLLALLFAAPFMFLHRTSYRLGKLNTETGNIAMGILTELFGAARLILGFGRQDEARGRYLAAFDRHTQVTLRSQTLATAVPRFFQPMAMLAIVIALGFAVQRGDRISELAAVMWSLLAAMPILASLIQGNISISNFLPSYEQLVSLRNDAAKVEEYQGKQIFLRLNEGIELKNITFKYPGRSQILINVSLNVRKGQMTALVGKSGSGKSTLTDLLLGLQIPEKGQVLIDGLAFCDWKQNSFRNRVGYVPQDPQLFNLTIRENMLWSFETANENEILQALQLANALDFVQELPQGIDTLVGDRGARLSGGQRQRIALARALLRKPELLILDEATSSLDSESERLIQRSIEQVGRNTTILVIAHRLSTISKANQVYVLSEGEIVEEGTFTELSIKTNGVLNAMIKSNSRTLEFT